MLVKDAQRNNTDLGRQDPTCARHRISWQPAQNRKCGRNHTALTAMEKEAHTPVSQKKQASVALDPRRSARFMWETSLSAQNRLRTTSAGCWDAEPIRGDCFSLQPQAPAGDPRAQPPSAPPQTQAENKGFPSSICPASPHGWRAQPHVPLGNASS